MFNTEISNKCCGKVGTNGGAGSGGRGVLFHNMREWGRQRKPEPHVGSLKAFPMCVRGCGCVGFTHTHTLISTVKKKKLQEIERQG